MTNKPRYKAYHNATEVKLKNRSVTALTRKDNLEILICRICTKQEAENPIPALRIVRGKVMVTNFELSIEAANALYFALGHELNKNNTMKANKEGLTLTESFLDYVRESYPIGTKVKLGHMVIEKRPLGWFDSNYNKIWVDESKIGTVYIIIN